MKCLALPNEVGQMHQAKWGSSHRASI
jgi:hypothetical protein